MYCCDVILAFCLLCVHIAYFVKLTQIGGNFPISIQALSNRSLSVSRLQIDEAIAEYIESMEYFSIAKCFSYSKCLSVSQEHEGYVYFVGWDPLPGKCLWKTSNLKIGLLHINIWPRSKYICIWSDWQCCMKTAFV